MDQLLPRRTAQAPADGSAGPRARRAGGGKGAGRGAGGQRARPAAAPAPRGAAADSPLVLPDLGGIPDRYVYERHDQETLELMHNLLFQGVLRPELLRPDASLQGWLLRSLEHWMAPAQDCPLQLELSLFSTRDGYEVTLFPSDPDALAMDAFWDRLPYEDLKGLMHTLEGCNRLTPIWGLQDMTQYLEAMYDQEEFFEIARNELEDHLRRGGHPAKPTDQQIQAYADVHYQTLGRAEANFPQGFFRAAATPAVTLYAAYPELRQILDLCQEIQGLCGRLPDMDDRMMMGGTLYPLTLMTREDDLMVEMFDEHNNLVWNSEADPLWGSRLEDGGAELAAFLRTAPAILTATGRLIRAVEALNADLRGNPTRRLHRA